MAESGNPFVALFGEKVINKSNEATEVKSLHKEGGVIGVYFSAHWCPPCRGFTPKLAEFYNKFKASDNGAKFEIIFASSDKDQNSFDEYFAEMPWLAVPFEARDIKKKLDSKFKVQGIPTLVFLDSNTGNLITANGRTVVMEDPEGKDFPWAPKPFYEIFAGDILKKDGTTIKADTLKGKPLLLYFSAHWCAPCRGFTPDLVKFYDTMKSANKDMELVFVSSDRDEAAFKEYYGEMPWLALPFGDDRKKKLSNKFDISGIPTLVVVDGEGNMITDNGRAKVAKDKNGESFPWYPLPVEELEEDNASMINDEACLVYFVDGDDPKKKAFDTLNPIAEEFKNGPEAGRLFFFVGDDNGDDDILDTLRQFLGIDETTPKLALINIPEQKKYVCDTTDITADLVKDVIAKFISETLDYKPLR